MTSKYQQYLFSFGVKRFDKYCTWLSEFCSKIGLDFVYVNKEQLTTFLTNNNLWYTIYL